MGRKGSLKSSRSILPQQELSSLFWQHSHWSDEEDAEEGRGMDTGSYPAAGTDGMGGLAASPKTGFHLLAQTQGLLFSELVYKQAERRGRNCTSPPPPEILKRQQSTCAHLTSTLDFSPI